MLFNSLHFLIFFPIVVVIFFSLKKVKYRNVLLLLASWYFYAAWKPEYIVLLCASTAVDYFVALKLEKTNLIQKRKRLVLISILVNLIILFSFKYFHFFDKNAYRFFGYHLFKSEGFENILLPVGISFYTFQTLSYTIDVYKKRINAEHDFVKFALFVSFFPQLVAGPIERAKDLLPQFNKLTSFDYKQITDGLKLITWGFFQKIVIADSMSVFVDTIYKHPSSYYGFDVWLVTFFFAIQIYGDFSGYTDIARGTAKVLGYNLSINFNLPYFAKSFADFWRRWHISLSSWFKDYIYIQLGGNRTKTKARFIFNVMFVFIISGFWHGASWNFLIWGALHGVYYLVEKLFPVKLLKEENKLHKFIRILIVFIFVNLAWMFFRSPSVKVAITLVINSFNFVKTSLNFSHVLLVKNFIFIGILFIVNLIERKKDIISYISEKSTLKRWIIYYATIIVLITMGNYGIQEFIYFRF